MTEIAPMTETTPARARFYIRLENGESLPALLEIVGEAVCKSFNNLTEQQTNSSDPITPLNNHSSE